MKLNTFVTVAATIAAPAMGQTSGEGFPECAISIGTSLLMGNGCELGDLKCTCSSDTFVKNVSELLPTACNAEDTAIIQDTLKDLCAQTGTEITFPPPAGASSSEPPTPTTSTAEEREPSSEATEPPSSTSVTPISSTEPILETTAPAPVTGSESETGPAPTSVWETNGYVSSSSGVESKSASGFVSVTVAPSVTSGVVSSMSSGTYAKSATDSADPASPTSPTVVAGANSVRANLVIGALLGLGVAAAM